MYWHQKTSRRNPAVVLAAVLAGSAFLAGCADHEVAGTCESEESLLELASGTEGGVQLIDLSSVEEALRIFTQGQAGAENAENGEQPVPRLLARSMPADLENLDSVTRRKQAFVAIVLPLALRANEEIRADRRFVENALACGKARRLLSGESRDRLRRLFQAYDADRNPEKLLDRLDTVPPSLILAQAAMESGWGTSRFAQQGNALFGQRTSNTERAIKAKGASVYVAAFPDLLASVRAYVHTLNTHSSYRSFRAKRAARRATGRWPNGLGLTETLMRYSERGPAYASELNAIIRGNDFVAFDEAHLAPSEASVIEGS